MLLRRTAVQAVGCVLLFLSSAAALSQATAATDAEIESCFASGKIFKVREKLIGVTKPVKVEVDCGGGKRAAVFKFVDEHKRGATKLASGATEFNFSDSYLYERAAYLLDRQLGLDMVPVAVKRRYQRNDGVLIDWIPDAVHEDRVSRRFSGPEIASLHRQKSRMQLFDSLIYNVDRRAENMLIDESTARLHLIDHSRAFREKAELRKEFAEGRVWLSRELYDNLVALSEEGLAELSDGLISNSQLKALLERRDLIIAKIDRDRNEYGDESVLIDGDG